VKCQAGAAGQQEKDAFQQTNLTREVRFLDLASYVTCMCA
jgi:hypothetical protein